MPLKLLDILTSPWAIMPEKLIEIQQIYATHLRGDKIDLTGIEAALGKQLNNEQKPYSVEKGVGIIEIHGVIGKKMNMFTRISGGVSTQILKKDFAQAMEDPDVKAILLDVDSPGGTVDGTEELAAAIYSARISGEKPIVAFTDGLMASAAYWIGSAAERIYISGETPWVGSIGVVTSHVDYSKYEEKLGVKTTEIYAGRYKRIDSEYNPLSQEGREYLQAQVDYIYSIFANTIAKARPNLTIDASEGPIPWADGKIFIGRQAIEAGLVDGVETKGRIIEKLSKEGKASMLRASIEDDIKRRLHKNGNNS